MRISVLASGSKGNSAFIEEGNTRMLIDVGVPCNYIEDKLKELDIDPSSINVILITHTHGDHIKGLTKFYKKYKPLIYVMPRMVPVLQQYLGNFEYKYFDKIVTSVNDININIIRTSHDAEDSVGFLINDQLVYITDTGYLNNRYFEMLTNKAAYIMESNHDIEMLQNGRYPHYLKRRLWGPTGHLSNANTSEYLSKLVGVQTKCIVLIHLSEENNTPELALNTLRSYVDSSKVDKVLVATQNERTELIVIE